MASSIVSTDSGITRREPAVTIHGDWIANTNDRSIVSKVQGRTIEPAVTHSSGVIRRCGVTCPSRGSHCRSQVSCCVYILMKGI